MTLLTTDELHAKFNFNQENYYILNRVMFLAYSDEKTTEFFLEAIDNHLIDQVVIVGGAGYVFSGCMFLLALEQSGYDVFLISPVSFGNYYLYLTKVIVCTEHEMRFDAQTWNTTIPDHNAVMAKIDLNLAPLFEIIDYGAKRDKFDQLRRATGVFINALAGSAEPEKAISYYAMPGDHLLSRGVRTMSTDDLSRAIFPRIP